ncbi:MAG TPA: antibiotic biosynthesis monooxygenase [Pseudonocardiaceae bacterium]
MTERPAAHTGEPVTVTIARRPAPGREAEFEDWATRLTGAAAGFKGFLGAGLLRPATVGQDWHVVYRFDSPEHLAAWEQSDVRTTLLAAGEDLMRTTGEHRVTGLETWFALPGRTAPAPPRWKMFAVSAVAIYSLSLVLNLLLGHMLAPLPLPVRLAPVSGSVTALMTWLVMPLLAQLLEGWLFAPPRSVRRAGQLRH